MSRIYNIVIKIKNIFSLSFNKKNNYIIKSNRSFRSSGLILGANILTKRVRFRSGRRHHSLMADANGSPVK